MADDAAAIDTAPVAVVLARGGLKEPASEMLENFTDLSSILRWAKVSGDPAWAASQAGSLLHLLGGLDDVNDTGEGGITLDIDELASIAPDRFDKLILQWRHSKYRDNQAAIGDEHTELPGLDVTPAAATLARAQTAHHAARIHSRIEWSREAIVELEPFETEQTTNANTIAAPAAPPVNDHPSIDPLTGWVDYNSVGLWKPSDPLHGDGTVRLNTTGDSSKIREIPIIADDAYIRGLEWYARHKYIEPPMEIKTSIHQSTAVLELLRNRSMYVDLGLLKRHDIRTARTNRWTDHILQNGAIVWAEIHSPAGPASWDGGWGVLEWAMLMANKVFPLLIEPYGNKFRKHVHQHIGCYGLAYQQDDRLRHEWVPELLRLETNTCNRRVAAAWWPGLTDHVSVLDPNEPWGHILHMMVRGVSEVQWWTDNSTFKAQAIIHKVKTQAAELDGYAPIGISRGTGTLDLRPPSAHLQYAIPRGLKPKKIQQLATEYVQPASIGLQTAPQPWPRTTSNNKSGHNEICKQYNVGKCPNVNASGQCGALTLYKRSNFIHACGICGLPGHTQQDCVNAPKSKTQKHVVLAPTADVSEWGAGGKGGDTQHSFLPSTKGKKGTKGKGTGKKGSGHKG